MGTEHKACPVIIREETRGPEILAFTHPLAGNQIVKGGVEAGEPPENAALRELAEESGITGCTSASLLGQSTQIAAGQTWNFVLCNTPLLPNSWTFSTADDGGHEFQFFWQPLHNKLDAAWHPVFVRAIEYIRRLHLRPTKHTD